MKTITVGEEKFGLDYSYPDALNGGGRYIEIKRNEEKHAKRHLYKRASDIFKNIHTAFLDQYELTDENDRQMGRKVFRMEYRVRGEVWDD